VPWQPFTGTDLPRRPIEYITGRTWGRDTEEVAAWLADPCALSIGTRSTSMFVQSVLGPTDRPTERQEARPAEAVRASDAKIPCGIFASHGEPEGL